MNERLYFIQLFAFYDKLLTSYQNEIMSYYYHEDFSLQEISDNLGISKAAVSDIIKRVEENLLNYEEKLQLLSKHQRRMKAFQDDKENYEILLRIEEEISW